jgi:hypothetical protein
LDALIDEEIRVSRVYREMFSGTVDGSPFSFNNNNVGDIDLRYDPFFSPEAVELIFNLTKTEKHPPTVRYLALQYFATYCSKRDDNGANFVPDRILFLIYVCVMLATKIESDTEGLTSYDVHKVLNLHGIHVAKHDVTKAEVDVSCVLGFRLQRPTHFTILEAIITAFENKGYLSFMSCGIEPFYNSSLAILDLVFLYHAEVYEDLFMQTIGKGCPKGGEIICDFMIVKNDRLALVSAVLSTAAWLLHKGIDDLTQELFVFDQRISTRTATPLDEINEFREAILRIIV